MTHSKREKKIKGLFQVCGRPVDVRKALTRHQIETATKRRDSQQRRGMYDRDNYSRGGSGTGGGGGGGYGGRGGYDDRRDHYGRGRDPYDDPRRGYDPRGYDRQPYDRYRDR